jgi:hypothetical protein
MKLQLVCFRSLTKIVSILQLGIVIRFCQYSRIKYLFRTNLSITVFAFISSWRQCLLTFLFSFFFFLKKEFR